MVPDSAPSRQLRAMSFQWVLMSVSLVACGFLGVNIDAIPDKSPECIAVAVWAQLLQLAGRRHV
jgi:hypothetical protein